MFGAILTAKNSSFKIGITFCRSIYLKKVMKLLAFIFEQPSYLSKKYEYFQTGMSENRTILITMIKKWVRRILLLSKRGLIIYLAALKKGAIRAAHPYYVI